MHGAEPEIWRAAGPRRPQIASRRVRASEVFRYIYVYAKHVDEDDQNPKLLAEHRQRAFFETAARCLREGKNVVICPVEKQSSTSLHSR